IHPFIDAALALRAQASLVPAAIAAVRCRVAPWQVPIVCEPRPAKVAPQTEYQARASLPFALAAALVDGRVDVDTFTDEAVRRPELLALATRVTHAEDADPGGAFAGSVELETDDGRWLRERRVAAPAPAAERLRGKFEATAGRWLRPERVAELAEAVER